MNGKVKEKKSLLVFARDLRKELQNIASKRAKELYPNEQLEIKIEEISLKIKIEEIKIGEIKYIF
jgi:hypothetical protein